MIELDVAPLASPLGPLTLVARGPALVAIAFGEEPLEADLVRRLGPVALRRRRDPAGLATRVRAYFAGDLAAVDAIEVEPGGTAFQRCVWTLLRAVPAGTTVTYGELARRLGRPGASRAVGLANHDNPIPIVIPCHRVVGARGHLTGYAGGLERKRWLLEHEGALLRLERDAG
jgi:methylated-DNA-[protein]-cysteine S-methyltransferase